ncbi:MAG: dTDP-4-dehydrorhamnose 3,5-epimerase [Acidobacteriota bacterium]|jgi:dTDP-4-dehydrorhamnose 3,5-epimerase|nr:dTDP-4-dehydrorhamnose 3,5-epimerase [Acidobacteriota bacterium]
MRFVETPIAGAYVIEPEPLEDERGFFARILDADEFAKRGLVVPATQWSVSHNRKRGTLRGLHYQAAPHEEVKLVRCTAGAIWDVIADLPMRRWFAVELSAENRKSLYIPRGIAHGFQTLTDDAEICYAIDRGFEPESARGVRWNDPSLAITWPDAETRILSDRDRALPLLE